MAAPLTATTELEAVNEMLEVIGEAPLSSLEVTGRADVSIARAILNRQVRRLCTRGWFWNTDEKYTLEPDGDGKFPVPTNALSVDPYDPGKDVTVRGQYLWDRTNNTDVFTDASIDCVIVRALDFEDLVEAARQWCVATASRMFAKRMLGDETTVSYTTEDVQNAIVLLEQAENDHAEHSLYQDPTTVAFLGYRNRSFTYVS